MEFEANYQRLKKELMDEPANGHILYYAPTQTLTAKIEELDKQIANLTKEKNRLELRYRLINRINVKTRN